MRRNSVLPALILTLAILFSAAGGVAWILHNNYLIDFRLYPKDAYAMDLRGENVSLRHYEAIREKMPDCQILWDVPFQDGTVPSNAVQIEVNKLSGQDVSVLKYFPRLESLAVDGCPDDESLRRLQESYPELELSYRVTIDGSDYPHDAAELRLTDISDEELERLPYLKKLKAVNIEQGGQTKDFTRLGQYCAENGIGMYLEFSDGYHECGSQQLTIEGITDDQIDLIGNFYNLQDLQLRNPQASIEKITDLQEQLPNVNITWDVTIGDKTFDSTAKEVDLSQTVVTDLAEIEQKMEYLPNVEKVIFGLCGRDNPKWGNSKAKNIVACDIENEDMAAYRDRVRDKYKVVWTVRLGPSIALRTDKDNFMPNHFGVGQFFNDYSVNLKYCEDMVCLDLGHMTLTDISFVEYMPKLKYFILAWTEVQYIEPIRSCKNLIWLELDNSCIRDYSPLVDCTALQDLNIGKTFCDITPITKMTWLKNLYMIFGSGDAAWTASQALPNTRVVANGDATVGGGWRRLPNYYDMRDCLHMYYMN